VHLYMYPDVSSILLHHDRMEFGNLSSMIKLNFKNEKAPLSF